MHYVKFFKEAEPDTKKLFKTLDELDYLLQRFDLLKKPAIVNLHTPVSHSKLVKCKVDAKGMLTIQNPLGKIQIGYKDIFQGLLQNIGGGHFRLIIGLSDKKSRLEAIF